MQSGKKGLSDLVSNVLIILLVFASIAIMGVIILNLVKISGESIENTAACKQINVKPVQCLHNITDANLLFATEYESGVVIKEVDTVAVFMDGTSANQSILGGILGNFETQSIRESRGNLDFSDGDKFYTVTKFTDTRGVDRTCVSDTIGCTLYTPSGASATDGNPDNGEVYSNGGTSLVKPTKSGGGSGSSGGDTGPVGTGTDGVCAATKYSCSVGTVNSTTGYNNSDFIWECSGINGGNSVSCKRPINSNNVFNLTQTCDIYTLSNYAGCSGVDINGSAYCWSYDVLSTPWESVAAGINLSASYLTVHTVDNKTYLNGNWLQQMPSNPNNGGPLTPGVAYQGAFSLDCLLGITSVTNPAVIAPTSFVGLYNSQAQRFDFTWTDNANNEVRTNVRPVSCVNTYGYSDCATICGISSQTNVDFPAGATSGSYNGADQSFQNCYNHSSSITFEIKAYNSAGATSVSQTHSVVKSMSSTNGYLLTLVPSGTGSGSLSVFPGINQCTQGTCSVYVYKNTGVGVTATEQDGSTLTSWIGCTPRADNPLTCGSGQITGNKVISAVFSPITSDTPTSLRVASYANTDSYNAMVTLAWSDNLVNEQSYIISVSGQDQQGSNCMDEAFLASANTESYNIPLVRYLEQNPGYDQNNFCDYTFTVQGVKSDGSYTGISNTAGISTSP